MCLSSFRYNNSKMFSLQNPAVFILLLMSAIAIEDMADYFIDDAVSRIGSCTGSFGISKKCQSLCASTKNKLTF